MIDLVLLQLDKDVDKVIVSEVSPFFQTKARDSFKWHRRFNPTPQHYREFGYLPTIDIFGIKSKFGSGYFTQRVVIQAAAPKVLHGTNYFGVNEADYDSEVAELIKKCQLIGLPLRTDQLEAATLRSASFSFNFYLPNDFPYPYEFLKKMSFLDAGKTRKGVKNTLFTEETAPGWAGRLYNPQTGFCLYDKRAELINKRLKTPEELEVVKKMEQGELPDKVLRMELNLQNQIAVKQYLTTRLGGDRKQTRHLRDVFNDKLAQGILTEAFGKIADSVDVAALDMSFLPIEEAFRTARRSGMSNSEAERLVGRSAIVGQIGSLAYKELQDRHYPRQRRYELKKSHERVLERSPLPQFALGKILDECRQQLTEFRILKPGDFSLPKLEVLERVGEIEKPPKITNIPPSYTS